MWEFSVWGKSHFFGKPNGNLLEEVELSSFWGDAAARRETAITKCSWEVQTHGEEVSALRKVEPWSRLSREVAQAAGLPCMQVRKILLSSQGLFTEKKLSCRLCINEFLREKCQKAVVRVPQKCQKFWTWAFLSSIMSYQEWKRVYIWQQDKYVYNWKKNSVDQCYLMYLMMNAPKWLKLHIKGQIYCFTKCLMSLFSPFDQVARLDGDFSLLLIKNSHSSHEG